MKPVKVIGQHTDVTKTRYSQPSDMHITGWDKGAGSGQASERAAARAADGQKKTPIGRGTAIKQR